MTFVQDSQLTRIYYVSQRLNKAAQTSSRVYLGSVDIDGISRVRGAESDQTSEWWHIPGSRYRVAVSDLKSDVRERQEISVYVWEEPNPDMLWKPRHTDFECAAVFNSEQFPLPLEAAYVDQGHGVDPFKYFA